MPELAEVEYYRRLAENALGRVIVNVNTPDVWFLKGLTADELRHTLCGTALRAARRRGKLLCLDGPEAVLGLRFGMTGRLIVDGRAGVDELIYSSARVFECFAVDFADGGRMVVSDPRRLGGVSLDPDESALGPDALAISESQLEAALAGSAVALKARLMDQTRVAGIGNLTADELLWRAALSPLRPAASLDQAEVRRLHREIGRTLAVLIERGGSHTGDLLEVRLPGGFCPRDGTPLRRGRVGGRTTYWCPAHQK